MNGFTVKDVEQFQDYQGDKGHLNRNTATGRKTAVSKVLGILDPEEQVDVRNIDLKAAFNRWQNLEGSKYDTSSLAVYESRMRSAVQEFLRYKEDPKSYKPPATQTRKRSQPTPKNGKSQAAENMQAEGNLSTEVDRESDEPSNTPPLMFSVPIRQGVAAWVRITGLPRDINATEANQAAALIKAMVEPMIMATAHIQPK